MMIKPFVKWAGGKRQILPRLNDIVKDLSKDKEDYTYIEPFLGGGALFFDLLPRKAIISDLNNDLINAYKVIQSDQVEELIIELDKHAANYKENPDEYYYEVRALDRRDDWPEAFSDVKRAARMIFLNRTCYNGLYRVNLKGQFNTPIGRYRNPTICDRDNLREIHRFLSENNIEIFSNSYEVSIRRAKDGDIIYVDPPYDYEDDDGFTKYQMQGFTFEEFKALKRECDEAINKAADVIISNNATDRVIKLFDEDARYKIFYDLNTFETLRNINCNGNNRRSGYEAIFVGSNCYVTLPQANDIEKIINLIMVDQETLLDKDKVLQTINVSSHRQVAYYLSALAFLGYIKRNKYFTDHALSVKNNRIKIEEDIFNKLKVDDLFGQLFKLSKENGFLDTSVILAHLQKDNNDKLGPNTLKRRASTIKSWIDWMLNYYNSHK